MAMPKRITAARELISIHDPAIQDLPSDVLHAYTMSLDIAELGDLAKLPAPPTIFTCLPLRASMARLDNGPRNTNDDWWYMFAFHVTRIEPMDGTLTFEGSGQDKHIADSCRELIPDKWIRDIGGMITKLANGDSPFAPPVGMLEMISMRKLLHAKSQEIAARSVAANLSESE